jgi:hypothetical protein
MDPLQVGTFASSYSYSASAWGNIIPYYIMPDRSYWNAGVSEPCFRFASRGHAERAAVGPSHFRETVVKLS